MSIIQQSRMKKLGLGVSALVLVGLGYFATERYAKPLWLGYQFEENLRKEPLFQTIAKEHPEAYAAFTQKVKADLRHQGDPNAITEASASLVNAVFLRYVNKAPDDALYQYLNATLALYRYLVQTNPIVIVKLENPQYPANIALDNLGSDTTFQDLFARMLNAKQQVIVLGLNHPIDSTKSLLSKQELLEPVLKDLAQKYTPDGVRKMLGPGQIAVPPPELAQFIVDFYTEIIDEGPEKSAMILRLLAKQG